MKISLISPRSGQCGTSSIGVLLALYISNLTGKEIAYLPIKIKNNDICSWFNIENETNILKSTSQIYQLMLSGSMSLNDIKSYATELTSKIDLFDMNLEALSPEERVEVQNYLISTLPYNMTFLDIGGRFDTIEGKAALNESQIVIIISNCMDICMNDAIRILEDENLINKKCLMVVNMQHKDNKEITEIKGKNNKSKRLKECVIFPLNTRIPSYQNEKIFDIMGSNLVHENRIDLEACKSSIKELSDLVLANIGDKEFLRGD